jgi:hypothetical protein
VRNEQIRMRVLLRQQLAEIDRDMILKVKECEANMEKFAKLGDEEVVDEK